MFPKHCGRCGRNITAQEWLKLPLLGLQDAGDGTWLELRHCRCGTTLAVDAEQAPASAANDSAPDVAVQLASCWRCGTVDVLVVWRAIEVCEPCADSLAVWATSCEFGARDYLRRKAEARCA